MISSTGEAPVERILSRLEGVEEHGDYHTARCPAHEDTNPSLSIREGDDGRALLKCHAGCETGEILDELGLQWPDVYPPSRTNGYGYGGRAKRTSWEIRDADGELQAVHHRYDRSGGKKLSWSLPDGTSGLGGRRVKTLPLYRSEHVGEWPEDIPVVLVEGEKAADALARLHPAVLGTVTGASSAPGPKALEILRGREVVMWPDNDDPGRKHMRRIQESLVEVASEVRIFEWKDAPTSGADAADHPAVLAGDPEAFGELLRLWSEASPDDAPTSKPERPRTPPTQTEMLLEYAEDADLFHAPDGECYATVPVGDHRETWSLKHRRFTHWLRRQFYMETGKAPSAQALTDARATIDARATFEGPTASVFLRVAGDGETVYLDLTNDAWETVEITPMGWRVIQDPPVKFIRTENAAPLPRPEAGGSLEDLRSLLNVATEDDFRLLVAWLVGALNPDGPYPLLVLQGEQGSAKSTTVRVLRSLVDPAVEPLRAPPRNDQDLAIAASGNWTPALDNLSGVKPWLSDALCRLSTGGGFATRELYSDNREMIFSQKRPVILNGIDSLAVAGDLRDRSIIVELPAIPPDRRRGERDLKRRLELARPKILGALLDAVSASLAGRDSVDLSEYPRLADFAKWVVASEAALGWPRGAFISAYTGNRSEANELALDDDPVAVAVRELMKDRNEWSGTSTELLSKLSDLTDEDVTHTRSWPKAPNALSNRMKRLAPALRGVGIQYDDGRDAGGGRTRRKTLQKVDVNHRPYRSDRPADHEAPANPGNAPGWSSDSEVMAASEQETEILETEEEVFEFAREFFGVGAG